MSQNLYSTALASPVRHEIYKGDLLTMRTLVHASAVRQYVNLVQQLRGVDGATIIMPKAFYGTVQDVWFDDYDYLHIISTNPSIDDDLSPINFEPNGAVMTAMCLGYVYRRAIKSDVAIGKQVYIYMPPFDQLHTQDNHVVGFHVVGNGVVEPFYVSVDDLVFVNEHDALKGATFEAFAQERRMNDLLSWIHTGRVWGHAYPLLALRVNIETKDFAFCRLFSRGSSYGYEYAKLLFSIGSIDNPIKQTYTRFAYHVDSAERLARRYIGSVDFNDYRLKINLPENITPIAMGDMDDNPSPARLSAIDAYEIGMFHNGNFGFLYSPPDFDEPVTVLYAGVLQDDAGNVGGIMMNLADYDRQVALKHHAIFAYPLGNHAFNVKLTIKMPSLQGLEFSYSNDYLESAAADYLQEYVQNLVQSKDWQAGFGHWLNRD